MINWSGNIHEDVDIARQCIFSTANVAKNFSKKGEKYEEDVFLILGLVKSERGIFYITTNEILSQIDEIKERIEAFLYVIAGVHALTENKKSLKELRKTMYGENPKYSSYTGEEGKQFDFWEDMLQRHPENAASYQAKNFG